VEVDADGEAEVDVDVLAEGEVDVVVVVVPQAPRSCQGPHWSAPGTLFCVHHFACHRCPL
jgi:hypothetical protein